MVDLRKLEGTDHPGHYLAVLKSLREFDRLEIENVFSSLFSMTPRENCFYVLYLRAQRNVDTLLELKNVAHFQALAMLGRAVFELCIDTEMLAKTPDGERRMALYKSLELLRAARSMVNYEDGQARVHQPSERRKYISEAGPRIEEQARELWPGRKLSDIKHWSALTLVRRVKELDPEIEQMYIHSYQHFSWYVHGGLQGTLEAPPEHFPRLCGMALSLTVISYSRLLTAVAKAIRLTTHDQTFDKKLELALGLPLAESLQDEVRLRHAVGL